MVKNIILHEALHYKQKQQVWENQVCIKYDWLGNRPKNWVLFKTVFFFLKKAKFKDLNTKMIFFQFWYLKIIINQNPYMGR